MRGTSGANLGKIREGRCCLLLFFAGIPQKRLLEMADAEQRREEAATGESPEVGGPDVRVQRDSDDVEMLSPGTEADLLSSPLAAVEVRTPTPRSP